MPSTNINKWRKEKCEQKRKAEKYSRISQYGKVCETFNESKIALPAASELTFSIWKLSACHTIRHTDAAKNELLSTLFACRTTHNINLNISTKRGIFNLNRKRSDKYAALARRTEKFSTRHLCHQPHTYRFVKCVACLTNGTATMSEAFPSSDRIPNLSFPIIKF